MRNVQVAECEPANSLADAVRDLFAARNRRDVEAFLAAVTEDVEYVIQGYIAGQPIVPPMLGKAALRNFLPGFLSRWDWSDIHIAKLIVGEDSVVLESSGICMHCVSGQRFATSSCDILEFRDGLVCKIRCYSDTFTIVRIAGLAM